jgi:competence protein ComFC
MDNLLSLLFPKKCFICAKDGESLCVSCLHSICPPIETPHHFISSRYSYRDIRIKKIIHAIKFFHRKDLIAPIAKELLIHLPEKNTSLILIPIPMTFVRRLLRGYNQSELLARTLSKLSGVPVDSKILSRKKSTLRQVKSGSRKERLRNQKNTFIVNKSLEDKEVIIIDDVTTTGATLLEAKRVLLNAGAQNVHAITIAH